MAGAKPYGHSGADWVSRATRLRWLMRALRSPSPRPSPLGRGRIVARRSASPKGLGFSETALCYSLSLRERVRVRGNRWCSKMVRRTTPGTGELPKPPVLTGSFPESL